MREFYPKSRLGGAMYLLAGLLIEAPAIAQQQPSPRPPTRQEIEPSAPVQQSMQPQVRIERGGALQPEPCPLKEFNLTTQITAIDFVGPAGSDLPAELKTLLAGIAPPQGARPIAVVCDIRDQANSMLHRAGYIAAVNIPPQRIQQGRLRLEVITGEIVEVRIRGDAPPFRDKLLTRAEQLKVLRPLKQSDAERILLLASDIPGVEVRLTLAPAGIGPGALIGELTVYYQPYKVLANVHNLGSRQLGRETAYGRFEAYGLTGASDLTYVAGSTSLDFNEQQVVQVGHVFGFGRDGMTLGGDFAYAWSKPDLGALDPNGVLDLRSRSIIGRVEAMAPLVRSRRLSLNLRGGLELLEQRTSTSFGPLTRDKLRVAFLRAEVGFHEPLANGENAYALHGALALRKGIDIFDPSHRFSFSNSRFEGDPNALVIRGEAGAVARLSGILSVSLDGEGQWANHPLLNFEEYSIGNYTIGRGYDPGAVSADRVIALRPEMRARVYQDRRSRVELFGFYDNAWLWNLDSDSTDHGRRIASWGGGIRGVLAPMFLLEATYAHPQDRPLALGPKPPARLLLSLVAQFSPMTR